MAQATTRQAPYPLLRLPEPFQTPSQPAHPRMTTAVAGYRATDTAMMPQAGPGAVQRVQIATADRQATRVLAQRLVGLAEQLKLLLQDDAGDPARVAQVLQHLACFPMTVELLACSQLGKPVRLLRQHGNPTVAELARALVERWRGLAVHEVLARGPAAFQAGAAVHAASAPRPFVAHATHSAPPPMYVRSPALVSQAVGDVQVQSAAPGAAVGPARRWSGTAAAHGRAPVNEHPVGDNGPPAGLDALGGAHSCTLQEQRSLAVARLLNSCSPPSTTYPDHPTAHATGPVPPWSAPARLASAAAGQPGANGVAAPSPQRSPPVVLSIIPNHRRPAAATSAPYAERLLRHVAFQSAARTDAPMGLDASDSDTEPNPPSGAAHSAASLGAVPVYTKPAEDPGRLCVDARANSAALTDADTGVTTADARASADGASGGMGWQASLSAPGDGQAPARKSRRITAGKRRSAVQPADLGPAVVASAAEKPAVGKAAAAAAAAGPAGDAATAQPGTKKDEEGKGDGGADKPIMWPQEDVDRFLHVLRTHGRDYSKLLEALPDKSLAQVRNFFNNRKKRYNLDHLLQSHGHPLHPVGSLNTVGSLNSARTESRVLKDETVAAAIAAVAADEDTPAHAPRSVTGAGAAAINGSVGGGGGALYRGGSRRNSGNLVRAGTAAEGDFGSSMGDAPRGKGKRDKCGSARRARSVAMPRQPSAATTAAGAGSDAARAPVAVAAMHPARMASSPRSLSQEGAMFVPVVRLARTPSSDRSALLVHIQDSNTMLVGRKRSMEATLAHSGRAGSITQGANGAFRVPDAAYMHMVGNSGMGYGPRPVPGAHSPPQVVPQRVHHGGMGVFMRLPSQPQPQVTPQPAKRPLSAATADAPAAKRPRAASGSVALVPTDPMVTTTRDAWADAVPLWGDGSSGNSDSDQHGALYSGSLAVLPPPQPSTAGQMFGGPSSTGTLVMGASVSYDETGAVAEDGDGDAAAVLVMPGASAGSSGLCGTVSSPCFGDGGLLAW